MPLGAYMDIIEELATHKYPKRTRKPCPKSAFADGITHRVGLVRIYSLVDGGVPGDVVREMCLECHQQFKRTAFVVIDQPNKIGTHLTQRAADVASCAS